MGSRLKKKFRTHKQLNERRRKQWQKRTFNAQNRT
jgi:hypothetical protein